MNYDAFIAEVEAALDRPFVWGENDCVLFADRCYHKLTGVHFVPENLAAYKTELGAARLLKKIGKQLGLSTFPEYMDTQLTRLSGPVPPRGAVVARLEEGRVLGMSIGVCCGGRNAFVARAGLVFVPNTEFAFAWGPR